MGLEDWILDCVHAFEFFVGMPDNTKTAMSKYCHCEPEPNANYAGMATYYGTAVMPAREATFRLQAVRQSERRTLARAALRAGLPHDGHG